MKIKFLILSIFAVLFVSSCHVYLKEAKRPLKKERHIEKSIPSSMKPTLKTEEQRYPPELKEELRYHDEVIERERRVGK